MTKLTERLWNAHVDDEEGLDHEFSPDELDALLEMSHNLRLQDISLDGSVGGPHPDTHLTVNFSIGNQIYKIENVPNGHAQELWEMMTHLPNLIEWAKKHATP